MAFPISPTNGQQATINGVVYTYNSSLTAWTVTSSGGSVTSANSIISTGNITGGNLLTGGLVSSTGTITSAANITGGNLLTGGLVSATANITGGNLLSGGLTSVTGNITGGNILTAGIMSSTGNATHGNILTAGLVSATGNVTGGNIIGFSRPSAGTTALAPILLTTGTSLTTATAGAIEYDGTALYGTENATTGRGELGVHQQYRYTAAGSALGPTIADYFPATSSINLEAASYYEIDAMCYFLKTTAGTVVWTWTNSSAAALMRSYYVGTIITGFTTTIVTGAPVTGMAVQQTSTALAHAASGSLTTAVYHHYHFKVHVVTTLATNLRLRATSSAGTITPQAGSYYAVRKISANAGNFAA